MEILEAQPKDQRGAQLQPASTAAFQHDVADAQLKLGMVFVHTLGSVAF